MAREEQCKNTHDKHKEAWNSPLSTVGSWHPHTSSLLCYRGFRKVYSMQEATYLQYLLPFQGKCRHERDRTR